jgi:hypothetical protein
MEEKDLDRDDLPIIKELMKLLDYYEPVYKQIPNWAKHGVTVPALNQALRDLTFYLISAAKHSPKRPLLEQADVNLDCVKHYIRRLMKAKEITPTQYEQLSKHTVMIGKQLGGWLNSHQ